MSGHCEIYYYLLNLRLNSVASGPQEATSPQAAHVQSSLTCLLGRRVVEKRGL